MKRTLIISFAVGALALVLLIYGLNVSDSEANAELGPIVLIVADDTGAFVLQIKQGAQLAASEKGSDLSVETVTLGGVNQAAQKWAERKAAAALIYLEDQTLMSAVKAAFGDKGIPMVAIQNGADGLPLVKMDEYQAGVLLAGYAAGYRTVYVLGDAPERLKGLEDTLSAEQTVIFAEPQGAPEDACALALTSGETARLAALREQGAFDLPLAGVDPGENRVQLMERGLTDALIFTSPYAMGYLAVDAALAASAEPTLQSYIMVYKEDIYKAENIKLMFPLLN